MLPQNSILQNRYRIIRPLGRGGFGHVYEALDETVNFIVAIKETLVDTDKLRRAFEREAILLANLKHPVLPRVTHYFYEGQKQYLVMDHIDGLNLGEHLALRNRPFAYDEILPWVYELLNALQYLHSRTPEPVIHRDIKPANIKLSREGKVFLLDFGLAKGQAGYGSPRETSQISSSVHAFTAEYAPLEQLNQSGTSPQSDLYSLGATLYTLLTKRVPVSASERYEKVDKGQRDSLIPAHQAYREVPEAISVVISQAMALSRRDRIASASAMRQALENAVRSIEVARDLSEDEDTKPASGKREGSAAQRGRQNPDLTVRSPSPTAPALIEGRSPDAIRNDPTIPNVPPPRVNPPAINPFADGAPASPQTPSEGEEDQAVANQRQFEADKIGNKQAGQTSKQRKRAFNIFISYRREDSSAHTYRLNDWLSRHFGEDQIFTDIDNIPLGVDFRQVIRDAVGSCDVLLAMIGKEWLDSSVGNKRRLDDPNDFVRLEIATALSRGIRVIPTLVQGASMPSPQDLPEDIQSLAYRNALEINDRRWKPDVERLIRALEGILVIQEQEEHRRRAEEERRQREEELRLEHEEKNRLQREAEEAERRRIEEAEARQRAEEEVARQRAEEERRRAEEEAQERAEEERKRAEAEARQRAEKEAAARLQAEVEARKRAEEEQARQQAEAEARRRAEEEAARLRAKEKRKQVEEMQRRVRAEEEARRKAEKEAARKRDLEEQQRAEEEARRKALEEAERLRIEAEAKRRAEEEARLRERAEAIAKLADQEVARSRAERERRREEEEARQKAEEERERIEAQAAAARRIEEDRLKAERARQLREKETHLTGLPPAAVTSAGRHILIIGALSTLLVLAGVVFVIVYLSISPTVPNANGGANTSTSLTPTVKMEIPSGFRFKQSLPEQRGEVWSVAFSPDGSMLAAGGADGKVRLWDAKSLTLKSTLGDQKAIINSIAFAPVGHMIASGGSDKAVRIWNTKDGSLLHTLNKHEGKVLFIAFSPDGKLLASASADKTIRLWDTASGDEVDKLEKHNDEVWSIAFSPDGATIASAGNDRTIRIWDIKSRTELKSIPASGTIFLTFSPDGALLASGHSDKTIKLWNLKTGKTIKTLGGQEGHRDFVKSVTFTPDGATLASASKDKTIKLWDVQRGTVKETLTGHDKSVESVSFSPDGKVLISGGQDQEVRVWQ